jgi:CheY-specific phosphatase CheX
MQGCRRPRMMKEKARVPACRLFPVSSFASRVFISEENPFMATQKTKKNVTLGTEDILLSLCNSVSHVLTAATQTPVRYSGMVQRISRTSLKPDIGCFVLFDGGFSGLVVINFSAQAAMELYGNYMRQMGMSPSDLAASHTSDDVANVMGELMNQIVGDFTRKVSQELQTHITQNQPKMLALNKQVVLSVDANLDHPEARRVTFYTAQGNIFYLELAIDRTQFIKLCDFEQESLSTDELFAQGQAPTPAAPALEADDNDALLKSLGM